MANNIGTLVIAPVRPQSTEDTYPVAYASELRGGYYQVSSLVEMYAIPAERRIEGLICWVTDTQKSYRLVGGIDNSNWQELVIDISSTGYTDAQAQAAVGSLLTSSGTFYFEYVPLGYIAGHVKLATSGGLAITSTGIFLEDVPITPGMYTKVVVNSRGQVIEGYLLTESDLPFHTHDDRYYTQVEVDAKFTSTGVYYTGVFSSTGHIHDDRYYTESESDLRYAPQSHTHSHGTLTGLDADDHTQYIRVDGTRNFTDVVSYDSDKVFVTSTALVSKGYVDTQDALIPSVTHEPTGFVSRTDSTISFDSGTRTFTISPTSTTFEVWIDGIKYEKETCQVVINDVLGLWYIYFLTDGTLACGQTVWNFVDGKAPVATVYWNGTTGILADERHGIIMDGMTHRYLHYAIGVRYISGLVGTFTDTSFSISNGIIYDEDIRIEIPTTEQCRVFYRGSGFYKFTSLQGVYYLQSSNILQYDNDGTLASVDNNKYIAMWVFATNTPDCPIHVLVGQRQDTTIANARLYNTYDSLVLYSLPSHEMKVIYRVIIQ